ncbi:hypothetical protein L8P05_18680 [Enterobacter cloacae]|uniref:hypothetical protein n=1 Tax=Enterobacter cloacae TaxID=550 RepID=UPI002005F8C6|nr:hypothetical protein [Enterobacter cloacae]MCK7175950.1 hypothetical protein [Enterobacter cloacae]
MRTNSAVLYIFFCLCQIVPICYVFIDKDVYGWVPISLIMGILVSFLPFVAQIIAAVGLEVMTGAPAMLFLPPLIVLLLVCHVTGGTKGVWDMLKTKRKTTKPIR